MRLVKDSSRRRFCLLIIATLCGRGWLREWPVVVENLENRIHVELVHPIGEVVHDLQERRSKRGRAARQIETAGTKRVLLDWEEKGKERVPCTIRLGYLA